MKLVTCINNEYFENIKELHVDGKYYMDTESIFIGTTGESSAIFYTQDHVKLGMLPLKLFTTVYDN